MSEPLLLTRAGPVAELRFNRPFAASAATPDFAEGLQAFFDKRPARYQGR